MQAISTFSLFLLFSLLELHYIKSVFQPEETASLNKGVSRFRPNSRCRLPSVSPACCGSTHLCGSSCSWLLLWVLLNTFPRGWFCCGCPPTVCCTSTVATASVGLLIKPCAISRAQFSCSFPRGKFHSNIQSVSQTQVSHSIFMLGHSVHLQGPGIILSGVWFQY